MGLGCPETSVRNYQSTPRNIPEERRSHTAAEPDITQGVNKYMQFY
jgi:hypothetical protein